MDKLLIKRSHFKVDEYLLLTLTVATFNYYRLNFYYWAAHLEFIK